MNIVKHSGIDLFFNGIKKKDAEKLCLTLNALDRTISGHQLIWKLTHKGKRATITARYPDISVEQLMIPTMLKQNRLWLETGLTALGMKKELYTGSEFYLKVEDLKVFKDTYNNYFSA